MPEKKVSKEKRGITFLKKVWQKLNRDAGRDTIVRKKPPQVQMKQHKE